jgi:predicted dehydrogenase
VLNLGGYPSSPEAIQASSSLVGEYAQEFEYDSVQFQYVTDDGVLCSGTVLASDVPHKVIQVHGDRGSIEIDVVSQSVTVLDRDYQASPKARAMATVDHVPTDPPPSPPAYTARPASPPTTSTNPARRSPSTIEDTGDDMEARGSIHRIVRPLHRHARPNRSP